ncbi:MAG: toll/interleukin-1 receptor domain-containing protein [Methylococcales bacterium]
MKNVFFSYAHGDELAARELRANLHNMEVAGWMDESDIAAGDAISKNIRKSLQRASAVIVLVSERSLNSP